MKYLNDQYRVNMKDFHVRFRERLRVKFPWSTRQRAVRPFTNLRKSFGGFSSENGGHVTAVYLSIVETCKLLKKPPLEFFRRFFGMIAEGRRDYELMTQELLC